MKQTIDFLRELRCNNNRDWFEANRTRYREVQSKMNDFAQQLIDGIAGFDPSVKGLAVRDCTYRINRDIRFSSNKEPYKTHIGIYVCPFGKKSGYAGYYFHVEPRAGEFPGCNLITSGLYMPEPKVLKSARWEIAENGAALEATIRKAKGFTLETQSKLKRVPVGFAAGSPYEEYLKLKDIYLSKPLSDEALMEPDLIRSVVRDLALTYDFTARLNRAVKYAFEEGM